MVLGVFCGDAALHGDAAGFDVILPGDVQRRLVELVALSDEDLAFHQIDAGDHFGDGVLDLDARVDLDEEEIAAVDVEQEFDRSRGLVFDGFAEADGGVADGFAKFQWQVDAWGDFDHLLMSPLHRAIALPEMHQVAVGIAEDLHFDVLGAGDVALDENLGPAEGSAGFALGFFELAHELVAIFHDAHATAAAAEAGFDDDGIADFLCGRFHLGRLGDGFLGPGHGWHICFDREALGGHLVAEHLQMKRRGADELDLIHLASAGQLGVLRKKPVTGMDRVDLVLFGQGDDVADVEV
jgi:hypothetical protein